MADPTLEELLAYQEQRAQSQQAPKQPTPGGAFEQFLSILQGRGNPVGQPLAPYDERSGEIRPRSLIDVILGRR
jgi:hypothetical protein